jgi:hypothetical protein
VQLILDVVNANDLQRKSERYQIDANSKYYLPLVFMRPFRVDGVDGSRNHLVLLMALATILGARGIKKIISISTAMLNIISYLK